MLVTLTLAWSLHKLREGRVGNIWTCKKNPSKNEEVSCFFSVFFFNFFFFLFCPVFVIPEWRPPSGLSSASGQQCTIPVLASFGRCYSTFSFFSFFLWSIKASSHLHGLHILWMGKITANFFFFFLERSNLGYLSHAKAEWFACSEETGSYRWVIFCQRFMPSSLRTAKTRWGDDMSSTGRGFGQSGQQNFDGMRVIAFT